MPTYIDHLQDQATAIDYLGSELQRGTLALVLGAGVSLGSGLPDWTALTERLLGKMGIHQDDSKVFTANDLQRQADVFRRDYCQGDEQRFRSEVKASLYDKVDLSSELIRDDLLIAAGALMTGSQRGSIARVMVFNYDCILEWYLSLMGLIPRVISQPSSLEGNEDVRVYHPHGFLPHPNLPFDFQIQESDFLIYSARSINERLGRQGDPWFDLMRHFLRTSICLFIGMSVRSFEDPALAPLLVEVGEELKAKGRPTGFWFFTRSQENSVGRAMLETNIVPMFLPDRPALPAFLLAVCRSAAMLRG